jgi:outer membrane protein assembly factor BamA
LDNATLIAQEIENAKIKLASVGYFAAMIHDSLIQDKHFLWITFGKKYAGIKVLGDAEWLAWLPKGKKSDFLSLEEYSSFLTKTLAEFHANGYPFASFHYSNFLEQDQVLTVSVSIDKGRKMIWKELRIKGDSSLSVQAMEAELKFKSGDNFTVEKQGEIYTRLKQLNYLQIIKPPEYQFSVDGVTVYLYVKGTKISSFNGAIGLQPNPISQKMGLTGDVQLKLVNTLKRAEQLDFVWRSVKPATQLMNLRFAYPFLFHSSFGTELKFQLYKRDSTFLELKSGLAIQYALSNKLLVKGLYSFTSNNRLYASNSNLDFPNTTSFRNTMFGLGITFRTLDYLPNPRTAKKPTRFDRTSSYEPVVPLLGAIRGP